MLSIPVGIALTGYLISSSLQLGQLLRIDLASYAVPSAGLAIALVCAILLMAGRVRIARRIVILYLVLSAADLVAGVALLVAGLTSYTGGEGGTRLLLDSVLLWLSNIQIFALIYWTLDAALWSPTGVGRRRHFFFPQHVDKLPGYETWEPSLFSYVYLAFTISTTYGPTDMPATSDTAKALAMVQAIIALALFTLTIARAVAIIG